MKKTFDFLEAEGIAYEFIDYKKQAPTQELLEGFADLTPFENLINKKNFVFPIFR